MSPGSTNNQAGSPYKDWLDQLSTEYKIVQDKLDKIGAFKFTIRGWSVTIVLASALGSTTLKPPNFRILLALIPVVAAFALMERAQERNSRIFGERALRLERLIWQLLRKTQAGASDKTLLSMVPRIGHDLADARIGTGRLAGFLQSHGGTSFYALQILLIAATVWWLNSTRVTDLSTLVLRGEAAGVVNERTEIPGSGSTKVPARRSTKQE